MGLEQGDDQGLEQQPPDLRISAYIDAAAEMGGVSFSELTADEKPNARKFFGFFREVLSPLRPSEPSPDFERLFRFLSDEEVAAIGQTVWGTRQQEGIDRPGEFNPNDFFGYNIFSSQIATPRNMLSRDPSTLPIKTQEAACHEVVHALSYRSVKIDDRKNRAEVRSGIMRRTQTLGQSPDDSPKIKTKFIREELNEILTDYYVLFSIRSHVAFLEGKSLDQVSGELDQAFPDKHDIFDLGQAWSRLVGDNVMHQAYFYGEVEPLIRATNAIEGGLFDRLNALARENDLNAMRSLLESIGSRDKPGSKKKRR